MSAAVLDKTSDPRIPGLMAEYEAMLAKRDGKAERWLDSLADDEFFAVNARWFGHD